MDIAIDVRDKLNQRQQRRMRKLSTTSHTRARKGGSKTINARRALTLVLRDLKDEGDITERDLRYKKQVDLFILLLPVFSFALQGY